ncbi:MAG: hypothetical protein V7K21_16005 [Nostoc sp.]
MRVPNYRPPSHPGEILLKDFLDPMGITLSMSGGTAFVDWQAFG